MDQRQDGGIDRGRVDQRLVALNIHDDLRVLGRSHFGHAVGTRKVVGARHPHRRSERACGVEYALVVGGNDGAGEVAGLLGTLVDVLQHGFGG